MKTLVIRLTLLSICLIAVTQVVGQNILYINSNNDVQTGRPSKSFQFVKQVTLTQGFYINGASGAWSATPYATNNNPQSYDKNFVRTESLLTNTTVESNLTTLPVESKSTTFSYTDGLNRNLQSLVVQGSPLKSDAVQFNAYDSYGHQPKTYLSYSVSNRGGACRSSPAYDQSSFYNLTSGVANDSEPFGINTYDNSPLNNVLTVNGPGQNWHASNKKTSIYSSKINVYSEVFLWTYDGTSLPSTTTMYQNYTLIVAETTDEQGLIHRSYKNFKGQLILDRKGDGTTWYDTYYVYDWVGSLRYVFPPEASSRIQTEYMAQGADQQGFLNRWCFQYIYDNYQRLTDKKIPGADWVYMIYDPWDRLVFTQSGNQRSANQNQWTFTKYDIFNRPIITGITTGSRSALTTAASNTSNLRYEVRANNSTGYTNQAYPSASEGDMLTIKYYDDYAFKNYTGWDAENRNYDFVNETTTGAQGGFPQSNVDLFTTVNGQTTGSKVKVLNTATNTWLNSVVYYDHKYRVIQSITENYIGGQDRLTNALSFIGQVKQSLQVHTGYATVTVLKEMFYDHAGRLKQIYQTTDSGTRTLLADNEYNEAGQLVERNLHSTDNGSTYLQSVDYRYNIRGWMASINNSTLSNDGATNNDSNDLFGMVMNYQQIQSVAGSNTTPLYNGNISSIKWSTNNLKDAPQEKIYGYSYDVLNRLNGSTYARNGGSGFNADANGYNESMTYDKNGNIKSLNRNMIFGGSVQTIDQLDYKYGTNSPNFDNNGNVLTYLDDNSNYSDATQGNSDFGFSENTKRINMGSIKEYSYDANGNLTIDYNKGITGSNGISYNYLNLPVTIPMQNGGTITYTYDAVGNKLRKVVQLGTSTTTDYSGNTQFRDGQLAFLMTDVGRAVKNASTYDYEYFLKDHLGNTRVVFGYEKETYDYKATLEVERNSKETSDFRNIIRSVGANSTPKNYETPNPIYAAALNGTVGPAKMLTVGNGDKVTISTNAMFNQAVSSSSVTAAVLASAVTSSYGFTAGEAAIQNTLNSNLPSALGTYVPGANAPRAFVFYYLFSTDNSFAPQFGYYTVPSTASGAFQNLNLPVTVSLPSGVSQAYMYITVANETTGTTVYFDDVTIVHEKNNYKLQVNQANDYYPFGLTISPLSYQKQLTTLSVTKNKYKFQGQEGQEELGLGWYQFQYRMHDPAIGRFGAVDPLAEKTYDESVYSFVGSNPISRIDPDGRYWASVDLEIQRVQDYQMNSYYQNLGYEVEVSQALRGYPMSWKAYSLVAGGASDEQIRDAFDYRPASLISSPRAGNAGYAADEATDYIGTFAQASSFLPGVSPMAKMFTNFLKGDFDEMGWNGLQYIGEVGLQFVGDAVVGGLASAVSKSKYAFGLKDVVPDFAESIGAKHLMGDLNWKSSFESIIANSENEIHFILDGIDETPMQMIMTPSRSGINWEMNTLYNNTQAFENTMFYYGGNTYPGYQVFSVNPYP